MRGVTSIFERIWEGFQCENNLQLGNGREEDIKTILKEECWYMGLVSKI